MNMPDIHAAVLVEINKPLKIVNLFPRKLEFGQVLVKIIYSGICRSQLMEVQGARGDDRWLPHMLGHEGSGIVESIGPGVTKVNVGDEVILSWISGEGIEAEGAKYDSEIAVINSGQVTTFSNYSVVSENKLTIKPDSLDFNTAILFGCALPTGSGMVMNELDVTQDSSIAVLGLGGIGISAVAMLLSMKVKNIVAIDISQAKLQLLKEWGVKNIIDANNQNIKKEVNKIYPDGVDFCIESAGKVETIEEGFSLIKNNGGKILFASHPPKGELIRLDPHQLISGKKIYGSWGGGVKPDRDFPILHEHFTSSDIPLNSLLTKPYSLININEALADLETGTVFRPLIKMEH
jgi:S-(hydroxymethyl)glutathione dehydrogenase/alcohol dehydrogenase